MHDDHDDDDDDDDDDEKQQQQHASHGNWFPVALRLGCESTSSVQVRSGPCLNCDDASQEVSPALAF